MSTPHNEAKKGDFAKTVLMPGDRQKNGISRSRVTRAERQKAKQKRKERSKKRSKKHTRLYFVSGLFV